MHRRAFLKQASLAAGLPLAGQDPNTEAFRRTPETAVHRRIEPWFPQAGLGLMLPWGPYSVGEIEGGWSLFRDMEPPNRYWPVEKYMALADRFRPRHYEPAKWLSAAAQAGFRYTIFTVRHHDGYAMWPSRFGAFGVRQRMQGRDLVRPFVEACRQSGVRIGFGYSPTDWLFNPKGWPWRGFPLRDPEFHYRRPERHQGKPRYADMPLGEMQRHFERFYAVVKGQMGELMTQYGAIDLVWWDGYDWPTGIDHHGQDLEEHVRRLQPAIVLNDRNMIWDKGRTLGDFSTAFENRNPGDRPPGVWEQCEAACGGWSYRGEQKPCKGAAYIVERLVRNRAWGGNYAVSFGPRPDGSMRPAFYEICGLMAGWMKHSGESVFDVEAGGYPVRASVPVTVRRGVRYLHFLSRETRTATLQDAPRTASARVLRTGRPARVEWDGDRATVTLPDAPGTEMDEVVALG